MRDAKAKAATRARLVAAAQRVASKKKTSGAKSTKASPSRVAGKKGVKARPAAARRPASKPARKSRTAKPAPRKSSKVTRKMSKTAQPRPPTGPKKKSGKIARRPSKKVVKKVARKAAPKPPVGTKASPPKRVAGKAPATAAPKAPSPPKKAEDDAQPTGMYNGILLHEHPKPFPAKTPYSQEELRKLRDALMDERARLLAELSSLQGLSIEALEVAKEHPGYSLHMAEHATDLQTAEAHLGVRSIEEARLELVDQAIERIEKNSNLYGLCLACGTKIGIQRLIARPHAHLCMPCRTRYEEIRSRRGY
jgi:RNA polymerase-binding transcription factor DksA